MFWRENYWRRCQGWYNNLCVQQKLSKYSDGHYTRCCHCGWNTREEIVVALCCSPCCQLLLLNANGGFWNQPPWIILVMTWLIKSYKRATQEDFQNQQEKMMQVLNQNQQIMITNLALLWNQNNNNHRTKIYRTKKVPKEISMIQN